MKQGLLKNGDKLMIEKRKDKLSHNLKFKPLALLIILIFLGSSFISPSHSIQTPSCQEVILPPLYPRCPMYPGPLNFSQPNNYTFLASGYGDEFGHIIFYAIQISEFEWPIVTLPIKQIDGWWYFCYWNESQCFLTHEMPSHPDDPQAPRIYWAPLLISTGVKVGATLPHKPFSFTQLNGLTFKAKLKGDNENPIWETNSKKLITQVPTEIAGVCLGIWYYAEYTPNNYIQSTGIPVEEHGLNGDDSREDSNPIPGFQISLLLPILFLVAIALNKLKRKRFFP